MRRVAWQTIWLLVLVAAGCAEESTDSASSNGAAAPVAVVQSNRPGSDWPCFLGPTGDSKSSETGILTRWPEAGPPLVWQVALGTGYCMPTVSAGRLFQFDRQADSARLRALDSRSGKV